MPLLGDFGMTLGHYLIENQDSRHSEQARFEPIQGRRSKIGGYNLRGYR